MVDWRSFLSRIVIEIVYCDNSRRHTASVDESTPWATFTE